MLRHDVQTQMKARQLTRDFPLAQQQSCFPQAGSGERPRSASASQKVGTAWAVSLASAARETLSPPVVDSTPAAWNWGR